MAKLSRARYTLEFKLEAVRMVKGGQSLAAVSKILGIAAQTLHNWVKAERDNRLSRCRLWLPREPVFSIHVAKTCIEIDEIYT